MIYLIVGLDRDTRARWHEDVQAEDATTAELIARVRAARQGIALEVAAAIGPYSSVVEGDSAATAEPPLKRTA